MLPAVYNSDYTFTIQSPCSHSATWWMMEQEFCWYILRRCIKIHVEPTFREYDGTPVLQTNIQPYISYLVSLVLMAGSMSRMIPEETPWSSELIQKQVFGSHVGLCPYHCSFCTWNKQKNTASNLRDPPSKVAVTCRKLQYHSTLLKKVTLRITLNRWSTKMLQRGCNLFAQYANPFKSHCDCPLEKANF